MGEEELVFCARDVIVFVVSFICACAVRVDSCQARCVCSQGRVNRQ